MRPVIDRVLPLEQAAEAHRIMKASEHFGKIVLRVIRGRGAPWRARGVVSRLARARSPSGVWGGGRATSPRECAERCAGMARRDVGCRRGHRLSCAAMPKRRRAVLLCGPARATLAAIARELARTDTSPADSGCASARSRRPNGSAASWRAAAARRRSSRRARWRRRGAPTGRTAWKAARGHRRGGHLPAPSATARARRPESRRMAGRHGRRPAGAVLPRQARRSAPGAGRADDWSSRSARRRATPVRWPASSTPACCA